MKRLWKKYLPYISDVLGFEAVINQTEGIGIVDDPSKYKQIRPVLQNNGKRTKKEIKDIAEELKMFKSMGVRVVSSNIRNEDIITGTEKKVLKNAQYAKDEYNPTFILLSHAPSSSMIGSDLESYATKITESLNLPCKAVKVEGEKDYIYGVSQTLETMGDLLLEPCKKNSKTVNILGCNSIDWAEESLEELKELLSTNGYRVLSVWGMKESTENLKKAARAEVNLVVNISGLRLVKKMETEFEIPYIVLAPFGKAQINKLFQTLQKENVSTENQTDNEKNILIVAEQLTANAIRSTLAEKGFKNVKVASFFDVDKTRFLDGDKKLTCEDDFIETVKEVELVIADPDLKEVAKANVKWINLPNSGSFSPIDYVAPFNMIGDNLDKWLDVELKKEGVL